MIVFFVLCHVNYMEILTTIVLCESVVAKCVPRNTKLFLQTGASELITCRVLAIIFNIAV